MALSGWIMRTQAVGPYTHRLQNLRSGNRKREEDLFATYLKEEPNDCFKLLLRKFCERNEDEKVLLKHLNIFVKILRHHEVKIANISVTMRDMLLCLRLALLNDSTIIRAAGLRCIRHTIKNETDTVLVNELLIPYLISRSLDLRNDTESLEAIKLTRKMLILSPSLFHIAMARSVVSCLTNEVSEEKNRLLRITLATLAEIGLVNPNLFIEAGGVTAITRNLIDCQIPKIAESLCGVLLLFLDRPETRAKTNIDLHAIAAPFCDFDYKHGWEELSRDERKLRLNCSRLSILTILKSWPGLLHFCNPEDQGGFKAIVDVLYLQQSDVRKGVLDLLFDLLGLQQPEWTDELSVALSAIDPCELQSSWRLKEGFVAAEGKSILPHLAKTTPSPTEMHMALLLFCFLECGLLEALSEVITSSDTFISVRATVLLSDLLRLIQLYLPPTCSNISPSLPTLLEYATNNKPQAMAAITALQQLHKLLQKRPASYSLHLDYIIRNSSSRKLKQREERSTRSKGLKSRLNQVKAVLRDSDDLIKDTGVLASNEAKSWNWPLIKMILRDEADRKLDMSDSSHKLFLKRLLDFFTPSKNKYSHMDLGSSPTDAAELTTSGIEFMTYLGDVKEPECQTMVLNLFKDIHAQIKSLTSRNVHDCLFSPLHMNTTHCQSYFLFIGQFVKSESGRSVLEGIKMFSLLQDIATTTRHECYVKLIISSLDYSIPGPPRDILDAVLTCEVENSRLYATQFLLVLLRAGYPTFAGWAVRLLCRQLEDKSSKVNLSALTTLQEACELPDCLETLTDLPTNLNKLGEKGELLAIRILSTEKGYRRYGEEKVLAIIAKWDTIMNYRYVKLVEGDISDSLTLHQRNDDGKYHRVLSNTLRGNYRKDIFLPPHLFGQLNQHADGFQLLTANASIIRLVETIEKGHCNDDEQIMKLKAALWAVGHFSTSNRGFNYLHELEFVSSIIRLTTQSPVYGVRSTAFYALGLVATTPLGADELCLNGWFATRHHRHDQFPILQEELMDSLYISYFTSSVVDEGKLTSNPIENISEDEITISEEEEKLLEYSAVSPNLSSEIRKITQLIQLPATGTPSELCHKRSLSDSKKFGSTNGFDDSHSDQVTIRKRNSSMTESTTSGVSSCDSLPNRQGGAMRWQTLSPIPSSTSLSILKLPRKVSRYSHRVSSNSACSDASTSSISGAANTNELSVQNMLGYQTIRYIRRRDSLNFQRTERDDYLFRPPPQTARRSLTAERLNSTEPSATIHYACISQKSEPKFDLTKTPDPRDALYRGICLPKIVTVLFPMCEKVKGDSFLKTADNLEPLPSIHIGAQKNAIKSWIHNKELCLRCSFRETAVIRNFTEDPLKFEILKIVERLANPAFSKSVKKAIIRLRQKEADVFKDICVYTEVYNMLATTTYSLVSRRILHELFLDVGYDQCIEDAIKITGLPQTCPPKGVEHPLELNDLATSPTEFRTLDSLNLISVENKFPIRTRNDEK